MSNFLEKKRYVSFIDCLTIFLKTEINSIDTQNKSFRMLKFMIIVFYLGTISLISCSTQDVYVYEKLPKASQCRRYTDYWKVNACNRKHQLILNKKLSNVMRTTHHRLSRKYNQKDKCKIRKYRYTPEGCYVSHLPSRANLPTVGKTSD